VPIDASPGEGGGGGVTSGDASGAGMLSTGSGLELTWLHAAPTSAGMASIVMTTRRRSVRITVNEAREPGPSNTPWGSPLDSCPRAPLASLEARCNEGIGVNRQTF
jgi:hypothetical protein